MRTKHLFYTAAMAALFAACVNDDFETISKGQNTANDGRPVVSNVKLNFTTGADTRLAFGEDGYAWETNDTIGALLMDNVLKLDEDASWLQKYQLVSNIHTSYPFTYSTSDQTWGCNTKMLEGNYFFAYPWEDYDGRREVAHSLLKQSQTGIGSNVVAESYADNQFFIGYSQIKAGTDAKDALTDVEMVPLLGAIQLRIVNTGTQSYHLNKIVLSGNDGIASVMTFNPTVAAYDETNNKWNLEQNRLNGANLNWSNATATTFNYANYTDNEGDVYANGVTSPTAVYNIKDGDKYDRIEALRAVAQEHAVLSTEQSAQLTINGTAEERELLPGQKNTAYVLIMCNPITVQKESKEYGLKLSIYADEGFVQNIDLSKVNGESTTNTVVTDAAVAEVGPSVRNTIRVQLEDNSFITPETMTIYNAADLLQFIQWNAAITGNRNAVATLAQDVTFTAEMLEALESNENTNLTITNVVYDGNTPTADKTNGILTLAEDLPANILDNKQLTISTAVVVEGSVALTEESDDVKSIEVAEGATLTINDGKANVPTSSTSKPSIVNNGTLNIGAEASLKDDKTIKVVIDNYGTIEAAKGSDSRAEITNNKEAVINNNGYMLNVTNLKDAVINMGEDATLSVDNAGKVVTADGATVNGENTGEIVYVEGAKINATDGTISTEYTEGTLNAAAVKALTDNNVNKVILTGSTTVTENVTIESVEVADGGELLVNNGVTLTVSNTDGDEGELLISGDATIGGQGTVSAITAEVDEEASLTVANTATITVSKDFNNEGMVYNNGTVAIPGGKANQGDGWKYNDAVDSSEPTTVSTMKVAVTYWIGNAYMGVDTWYAYNPNDIKRFMDSMNEWLGGAQVPGAVEKLAEAWGVNSFSNTMSNYASFVSAFNSAVQSEVLNAINVQTVTPKVIASGALVSSVVPSQDPTLYPTEAAANNALYADVVEMLHGAVAATADDKVVAAAVWGIANLETYLANTTNPTYAPYTYIWKGCPLDEVMKVYRLTNYKTWNEILTDLGLYGEVYEGNQVDRLKAWMEAVIRTTDTGDSRVSRAKTVVEQYIMEYQDWQYSAGQIANAGK